MSLFSLSKAAYYVDLDIGSGFLKDWPYVIRKKGYLYDPIVARSDSYNKIIEILNNLNRSLNEG